MARLGRSYTVTAIIVRAPQQQTQITADTGTCSAGFSATSVAKKVATVTGVCAAGLSATGAAKKVAATSGTSPAGFSATGTASSQLTVFPRQPVVVNRAALDTARKRAGLPPGAYIDFGVPELVAGTPETGVCSAGFSATATGKKVAAITGVCAAGFTSTATETSQLTAYPTGVTIVNRAAISAARQRYGAIPPGTAFDFRAPAPLAATSQTGITAAGLASSGTAVKVAATTGRCGLAPSAIAAAKKVAPETGVTSAGFTASGQVGTVLSRAVTGVCSAGDATRATVTKLARSAGVCAAGIASTGTARKRTAVASSMAVALSCTATAAKRARATGVCAAAFVAYQTGTARSVTGRCSVSFAVRHHRHTRRPYTGTTRRPYAGITQRP